MKVLALVTDAFGGYGGIAQYNRDFLTALASLQEVSDVQVLPRIAPEPAIVPAQLTQHPRVFNPMRYSLTALKMCLKQRPDMIFCGHVYHGPLAARLASLFGTKLVSQLHGTEVWRPLPRRHLRPLEKSDRVLCVSQDTRERYLSQIGSQPDNAAVLHNTVDPRFAIGDRPAARRAFGLTDEFAILSVSRLDAGGEYKGHDRVLKAMPRHTTDGRKVVYLIAGVGNGQGRLETMVDELNLAEQVRFLGKVPQEKLPELYRAADLFALPSTGEGFGIVFLEAMACGTPAIGLAVGGAPDALFHAAYGVAVAPDEFETCLVMLVDRAKSITDQHRQNLSSETYERFGQPAFAGRLAKLRIS